MNTVQINVPVRPLQALAAIVTVTVGVLVGILISTGPAGAQAATVVDTSYTAITPCASFDSRTDTGGLASTYAHGETRTFQITGVAPSDQQAGVNCGVPAGADAVLLNVVAIQPTQGGNLRAFATGDTGTGGIVNYSPVTPNLNNSNAVVIPLSASGQVDIENNCGGCAGTSVHARGVILGYFTDDLAQRVAALEAVSAPDVTALQARIEDLETLLADVTRDNGGPGGTDRLLFTGMNLQLVDGTGNTQCTGDDLDGGTNGSGETCNGEGNLIIGYNEDAFSPATRTGSHSLVVGQFHSWTTYGHILGGVGNTASDANTSVLGGRGNVASGPEAAILGGNTNVATGRRSAITGGLFNEATGQESVAVGGRENIASGTSSTAGGGYLNQASGTRSVSAGGTANIAFGSSSTANGGSSNQAIGIGASVSGGSFNQAQGSTSSITGGTLNIASGDRSGISGGNGNLASADESVVTGGLVNSATGVHAVVTGGFNNVASGENSTVTGGAGGEASGNNSSVSGGQGRSVTGPNDWRAGSLFENN